MVQAAVVYEQIGAALSDALPRGRQLLDDLAKTPELGFFETRTSEQIAAALRDLGYQVESGLARTGLRARLAGRRARPCIAMLAELDALPVPDHAQAQNGVAHACGHHAQLVNLYLVAAALRPVVAELGGSVAFLAVPAEEFVDLDRRLELRRSGEIEFLSGKAELVRLGAFDDIDMAILVHSTTRPEEGQLAVGGRMNGMLAKYVHYIGRAAHAGAAPHLGVNALSAAHVAIAGLNAAREGVRDEDHVRFHAVITEGGRSANVIPDDVRVEALVRAATSTALADAGRKAHRAFRAGAIALGAGCVISTIPGYLPLEQDPNLLEVLRIQAEEVAGSAAVALGVDRAGSSDMGDLSQFMPVVQPWAGGTRGSLHGSDFEISDLDAALTRPATVVARTIAELLLRDAASADRLLSEFRPHMSKQEYLAFLRGQFNDDIVELEA
jgi:amidohydrolase